MKKLYLIMLVLGLAALAGCGGKTIVVMSPAPAPTVTVTPSPEATPTPTFTADEQRTYDFVSETFPKLEDMNATLFDVLDNGSNSKAIIALGNAAQRFVKIKRDWNRIDWAYGAVSDLEDDFNIYVNATTRYLRAWGNGIYGNGSIDKCVEEAYKARQRIESYDSRVTGHLAELAGESY